MTKESKKGQRIGVLILYIVVLLGLLAGFFIPLNLKFDDYFNNALAFQIPGALSAALANPLGIHIDALDNLLVSGGGTLPDFAISAEMSLGEIATIDFNAWLTLVYAVVTVIAVICIIPEIVGVIVKKTKQEKAAEKADSQAEAAAAAASDAAAAAGYIQDENSNWKNPFGRYTNKDDAGNPIPVDENGNAFPAGADGSIFVPALADNTDAGKAALYNYAAAYAAARTATAEAQAADAAAAEAVANKKKKRETTYHTAFTLEVIAAVVLLLMNFFVIMYMEYNDGGDCIPVLIALGVVVIVGFIQRCIASGASGVAKFILFLLAFIAVLVAFFDITKLLEADTVDSLTSMLDGTGFGIGVTGALGFEYLGYFLFGAGATPVLFEEGITTTMMIFEIGGIITCVMVLANCLFDLLGIYKSTNKFMLVADQVIYLLEIVGIILMIVPAVMDETIGIGIMMLVLIVLVVASYIIDLVRLIMYNHKKKAAKAAEEEETVEEQADIFFGENGQPVPAADVATPAQAQAPAAYSAPAAQPAQQAWTPVQSYNPYAASPAAAPTPAPTPAPAPAPAPVAAAPVNETFYPPVAQVEEPAPAAPAAPAVVPVVAVEERAAQPAPATPVQPVQNGSYSYNFHALYNGPSDGFISKLTNDEKVEFAQVFLERTKGALTVIPEYKVGGDNTKFFSNVIIYYSRVRDLVSDGLMNKLYDACHVMK